MDIGAREGTSTADYYSKSRDNLPTTPDLMITARDSATNINVAGSDGLVPRGFVAHPKHGNARHDK